LRNFRQFEKLKKVYIHIFVDKWSTSSSNLKADTRVGT